MLLEKLVNPDCEAAILAALLIDQRGFDRLDCALNPGHFSDAGLGALYGHLADEDAAGRRYTPALVLSRFPDSRETLSRLALAGVSTVNLPDYARAVIGLHKARTLARELQEGLALLESDHTYDIAAHAERALTACADDAQQFATRDNAQVTAAILADLQDRMNGASKCDATSGLSGVDEAIGGFRRGNLYIVAGRPGMGKSAFVATMLARMLDGVKTPGLISLEMTAEQFVRRIACIRSGTPYWRVDKGRLAHADFPRIAEAANAVKMPISDASGLDASRIRSLARGWKRKRGIDALVIDHIGLADTGRDLNQARAVGDLTKTLKILAKELDIPVIAVCQLNRGVEKRDVKRPTLADLRDSGRIEEDADVILMLYRSEYYLRDLEPDLSDVEKYGKWQAKMNDSAGRAEVIVAKNRHGETSAVKCLFMKETMEFKDA